MDAETITGCLLGTAVGDALGLPYEGLSPGRAARLFKDKDRYHFLFNRGMVSDDTEHACMTAQALMVSAGDAKMFKHDLARRLRYWLIGLPAGVGFATLRAILKLWIGVSPDASGVFSAGNGPAMRSPIIGVCYGAAETTLKPLIKASTLMTHTDPKAYYGAIAVAVAAHESAVSPHIDGLRYYHRLEQILAKEPADEFLRLMRETIRHAQRGERTQDFVRSLGLRNGVTGYMYHTIPAVIHAWLLHPKDLKAGLLEMIACGGDTDTTAAILGAIIGAAVGKDGIPAAWLQHLAEWPRSVTWMETLGKGLHQTLTDHCPLLPPRLPIHGIIGRNVVFLLMVLGHGCRRLFPPY